MTPFSQYKGWLAEGGIRNALDRQRPGRPATQGQHQPRRDARGRPDADAARSRRRRAIRRRSAGRELPRSSGKSWVPVLAGQRPIRRGTSNDYLAWETLRQPGAAAGRLEDPLGVQAVRARATGSLFNVAADAGRAQGSRCQGAARQAEGAGRPLGRLRAGEQRDAAEPLHVRDAGRPAAAAHAGRPGLPAAYLQAAVRAARPTCWPSPKP
jgi:hypothetical protein